MQSINWKTSEKPDIRRESEREVAPERGDGWCRLLLLLHREMEIDMISLCHNFPHRSIGAATANDAVAYISNSICAPAKTKIKTNLAKNWHYRQIAAHTTSNSFAANRAVSLSLSLCFAPSVRHPALFRPGILKNANINPTFNRLLSLHGVQR